MAEASTTLGKLSGFLHLECAQDSSGRTFISKQGFRAPLQIGKGYWTGEVLLIQAVNPTAGLFRGDSVETKILVRNGAKILFTSPSATRSHTMESGRAEVEQYYSVETNGWLEIWPELFIPQRSSDYEQRTRIETETGASFFLVETLAPGRVAHHESLAFRRIAIDLELRRAGKLIALERYELTPDHPATRILKARFPNPYSLTAYFSFRSARLGDAELEAIYQLHSDSCWVGCSEIESGVYCLRMVGGESGYLRENISAVRRILVPHEPALAVSPRKL